MHMLLWEWRHSTGKQTRLAVVGSNIFPRLFYISFVWHSSQTTRIITESDFLCLVSQRGFITYYHVGSNPNVSIDGKWKNEPLDGTKNPRKTYLQLRIKYFKASYHACDMLRLCDSITCFSKNIFDNFLRTRISKRIQTAVLFGSQN